MGHRMKRMVCIIPEAKAEAANAAIVALFGADEAGAFTVKMNPSGRHDAPATHRIFDWTMPDAQYDELAAVLGNPQFAARISSIHPDNRGGGTEVAAAAGLKAKARGK
jgi:hypothetical protein